MNSPTTTNDVKKMDGGRVSFSLEGGPSDEEMKKVEAVGFGLGTLSVVIHEEHDARDTRDAAISAASATLKVAEQSLATEKKLRAEIAQLGESLRKEREEHSKIRLGALKEIGELKAKVETLEVENEKLKKTKPAPVRRSKR
jgi:hypothetical protein